MASSEAAAIAGDGGLGGVKSRVCFAFFQLRIPPLTSSVSRLLVVFLCAPSPVTTPPNRVDVWCCGAQLRWPAGDPKVWGI
jgi:hypothetical protein